MCSTRIESEPTAISWPSSTGSKGNSGLGERMDAHRDAVLERQAAVAGDMIGVRMGLEHADDPHACLLGFFEVGLDRVGGVDDHRLAGRLVADQVGRAAEVVIHKLAEQHVSTTLPTSLASFLEVSSTRQRALVVAGAILVAGLVVGAVALTLLDSGHGSLVQAPTVKPAAVAPPPPAGALVLAQEAGSRAVALAVGQGARPRLTATVLGSSGDPASGLALSFRVGAVSLAARSCGPGCYAASAPRGAIRRVQVVLPGGGVTFRIPPAPQPAAAIVARAARVFRGLGSLVYVESLRSSPRPGLLTTWR